MRRTSTSVKRWMVTIAAAGSVATGAMTVAGAASTPQTLTATADKAQQLDREVSELTGQQRALEASLRLLHPRAASPTSGATDTASPGVSAAPSPRAVVVAPAARASSPASTEVSPPTEPTEPGSTTSRPSEPTTEPTTTIATTTTTTAPTTTTTTGASGSTGSGDDGGDSGKDGSGADD